jgi:hypothetical protein
MSQVITDRNEGKLGGKVVKVSKERGTGERRFRKVKLLCKSGPGMPSFPIVKVYGEDADTIAALPKKSPVCFAIFAQTYTGNNPETGDPYKGRALVATEVLSVETTNLDPEATFDYNELIIDGEIRWISPERPFGEGRVRREVVLLSKSADGKSNSPTLTAVDDGENKLATELASLERGAKVSTKGCVRTFTGEKDGRPYTATSLDIKAVRPVDSSNADAASTQDEQDGEVPEVGSESSGSDS